MSTKSDPTQPNPTLTRPQGQVLLWCRCASSWGSGLAHTLMPVCLTVYTIRNIYTTFNNGSLGSCNDEERSEMRKVMRFA